MLLGGQAPFLRASDSDDEHTLPDELFRSREADAGRGAGDDDDLFGVCRVHFLYQPFLDVDPHGYKFSFGN